MSFCTSSLPARCAVKLHINWVPVLTPVFLPLYKMVVRSQQAEFLMDILFTTILWQHRLSQKLCTLGQMHFLLKFPVKLALYKLRFGLCSTRASLYSVGCKPVRQSDKQLWRSIIDLCCYQIGFCHQQTGWTWKQVSVHLWWRTIIPERTEETLTRNCKTKAV